MPNKYYNNNEYDDKGHTLSYKNYNIVAYIYLIMTISLSLALRRLEQRLRRSAER